MVTPSTLILINRQEAFRAANLPGPPQPWHRDPNDDAGHNKDRG